MIILPSMSFQGLTAQQLTAFARLRLPEMSPIVEALDHEHEATLSALSKADEMARVYRLQGRASVLNELTQLVASASDRLATGPKHQ